MMSPCRAHLWIIGPADATTLAGDEGFEFVLLPVEVWTRRVAVRVGCVEAETTRELSDAYDVTIQQATPGTFPRNPATDVLYRVTVELSDDVGTAYQPGGGHGPGWDGMTGIRWLVEWSFHPSPPDGAHALRVQASVGGRELAQVELPLTD